MRAALVTATLLALAGCGAERPAPATFTVDRGAPAGVATGRKITDPATTARRGGAAANGGATTTRPGGAAAGGRLWTTAQILRRADLRAAPGGRVIARVGTRTEFGSDRVLAVTGRRGGWLRVLAAERPNGAVAWVPARAVRLGAVDVSLHVDRSSRTLTVRRGGRVVHRMPVAVGRPGTPTPTGRFAVTDRLRTSSAGSPYGCCALALSGHQTRLLPGWPGGDRLAIHGTPHEETVGQSASLGCMRARAGDLRALMRVVPLGAPVFVRA